MTFRLLGCLGLCVALAGCPSSSDSDTSTGSDVPAVDAPTMLDAPTTSDTPGMRDTPSGTDVPVGADTPVVRDTPATPDTPASTGTCDQRRVLCDAPVPKCPTGEAPLVMGTCWGPCIPATMCTCTTPEECPDVPGYSETCYTARGFCGPFL